MSTNTRATLFNPVNPLEFTASQPLQGYGIVADILTFLKDSEVLTNKAALYRLLDKALCRYLLNSGSGKSVYQTALEVRDGQGALIQEVGFPWYDRYFHFRSLHENDVSWVRVNRALHLAIATNDVHTAAEKFGCDEAELAQLLNWYNTRVAPSNDLVKVDLSGNCKKCKACKEGLQCTKPDTEWWTGDVYDESLRYVDLYHDIYNHCKKKLQEPGFRYLSDIYEDLGSLCTELAERGWPAVLVTSHRADPTESLKMAKSYINRFIHHLAIKYTQDQKRQVMNDETGVYEIQELGLLDDTEIDASKMSTLAFIEEGYAEAELNHVLQQYLSPAEQGVVDVLMQNVEDPEFEAFAFGKTDRRICAFAYFNVTERQLRETLLPLLGRKPVEGNQYKLVGVHAFKSEK
jgi:hypothetical protein